MLTQAQRNLITNWIGHWTDYMDAIRKLNALYEIGSILEYDYKQLMKLLDRL